MITSKQFLYISDAIVAPIFLFTIGGIMLWFSLFGELPDSKKMIKFQGTISQCNIKSAQRGIYHAFITLHEYTNTFEDPYFTKALADSLIKMGDTYTFHIRAVDSTKLNTGANILTWSTNINGKDLETLKQSIKIQKAAKYVGLPLVSLFLITIAIYIRKKNVNA